jgi:hypothetical protein
LDLQEAFYETADVVGTSVFTTSEGQKEYSYLQSTEATVTDYSSRRHSPVCLLLNESFLLGMVVQAVADAMYDQNDSIAAFSALEGRGLVSNGPGFMQLPLADFAGMCNDLNYATFENRVEPQSCARTLSADADMFEAQCTNQFSVSKYVTSLLIAR